MPPSREEESHFETRHNPGLVGKEPIDLVTAAATSNQDVERRERKRRHNWQKWQQLLLGWYMCVLHTALKYIFVGFPTARAYRGNHDRGSNRLEMCVVVRKLDGGGWALLLPMEMQNDTLAEEEEEEERAAETFLPPILVSAVANLVPYVTYTTACKLDDTLRREELKNLCFHNYEGFLASGKPPPAPQRI